MIAALSMVIWPVAVYAIVADPYKDEKFVKFHAIQGLGIGLALTVVSWIYSAVVNAMFWSWTSLGMLGLLSSLMLIVDVVIGVYLIIQAMKVYNGSYVEIPVVYGLAKNYIGE
jgi:uncharacterized membrane protein